MHFLPTELDFSLKAIKKSQDFFKHYLIQGKFIHGNFLNLDRLKIKEHDVVWNSGVMEHFNDTDLLKIFHLIKGKTKKFFIFLVPNPLSFPYLLFRYKLMRENKWNFGQEYLRLDYDKFLKSAGFNLIVKKFLGFNFTQYFIDIFFNSNLGSRYYSELLKNKLIPEQNAYLVAYITTTNNNKTSLKKRFKTIDNAVTTKIRTKNFDQAANYEALRSRPEKAETILPIKNNKFRRIISGYRKLNNYLNKWLKKFVL